MSQIDTLDNLSQKQRAALLALLGGASQADAATAAGCHVRTIKRWLAGSEFSQALNSSVGASVAQAAARLASLADIAIDVLSETMQSQDATISQRLRASNFTLSHLLKLAEAGQIIERIDALEARLNSVESPLNSDNRTEG